MLWCNAVPHQSEFDLGGEALPVEGGLDEDDDRCGHGFGQLVCPDGVVLQRQVGESHEAAEAQCQEQDAGSSQPLGGENVHLLAHEQPEPRDHKVHQGQGHVGEAVVHVDPFIHEDNADGGEQVDQQSCRYPAVREEFF